MKIKNKEEEQVDEQKETKKTYNVESMSKERLEEIAPRHVLVDELEEEESDEQNDSMLTYDSKDVGTLAYS